MPGWTTRVTLKTTQKQDSARRTGLTRTGTVRESVQGFILFHKSSSRSVLDHIIILYNLPPIDPVRLCMVMWRAMKKAFTHPTINTQSCCSRVVCWVVGNSGASRLSRLKLLPFRTLVGSVYCSWFHFGKVVGLVDYNRSQYGSESAQSTTVGFTLGIYRTSPLQPI